MFLYHAAGAILVFRYVFRDPKVDIRLLVAGALLPNVIDKPLSMLADGLDSDRLAGHSLLLSVAIMVAALVVTRRGRRRRAWMAVAIGAMIHLALDGMWTSAETFLWPFLGWAFDSSPTGWSGIVARLSDPVVWVKEAAGAGYLAYLWTKSGLSDAARRRSFLADGRLPA